MSTTRRLSDADYRALSEFRYRIRSFLHFSERAARAGGVEPAQHQLLLAVRGLPHGGRATIGAVAERLKVRHHSAVELVDRLEVRGLVERRRDPEDRRQVLVRLTPAGEAILRQLSLHHLRELRSEAPALVRLLAGMLKTVGAGYRPGRRPAATEPSRRAAAGRRSPRTL